MMAKDQSSTDQPPLVVIGGGIAGVTCAQVLAEQCPTESILIVSASPLLKRVANLSSHGIRMESFDVEEIPASSIEEALPNVKVRFGAVARLDADRHQITLDGDCDGPSDGSVSQTVSYKKLVICTGARPALIAGAKENADYVIGIRDTESVQEFQKKLTDARRILIVGNGGIATELVYELSAVEVIWAIKDKSIGTTFFDAGVAHFLINSLTFPDGSASKTTAEGGDGGEDSSSDRQPHSPTRRKSDPLGMRRAKYTIDPAKLPTGSHLGNALGPDWTHGLELVGSAPEAVDRKFTLETETEVEKIFKPTELNPTELDSSMNWPIYAKLTNGKLVGCDLIVSATGVEPFVEPFLSSGVQRGSDGGLLVDCEMRTNLPDVYAAGDVATAGWDPWAENWFQMRLWTQARQMGHYAAHSVAGHLSGDMKSARLFFSFDVFTHVTKFFNHKVILLGLYNGQRLDDQYEILVRETPNREYCKLVLTAGGGRVRGAIFIGETDLEETFENLIHNATDVSRLGDDLLNPDVDIEDYFD